MSHAESTQAHSALVSARERWTESMKEEKTRKSGGDKGRLRDQSVRIHSELEVEKDKKKLQDGGNGVKKKNTQNNERPN